MPIESGNGGVGAFRSIARENGAQPLSSAYREQPWLGDAFNFQKNVVAAMLTRVGTGAAITLIIQ